MAKRPNNPKWISLKRQQRAINKWLPAFTTRIQRGTLSIHGVIKPRPLSCAYTIQIYYRLGLPPLVFVLEPKLELHPDWKSIPHVYKSGSLCLFFPDLHEWECTRLIAKTTIPWAALWLAYYEFWLTTGNLGGWGEHPAPIEQLPHFDRADALISAVEDAVAGRTWQNVQLKPVRMVA